MSDLAPAPTLHNATRNERRAFGLKLHEIEGNPLYAEDIALFDREGLTGEQRIARLTALAKTLAAG